ncbi:MAG: tetratricopeptide repeat protein [bacterium]|jgi:tetratricopeptide (TPR) repeat protein
MRDLYRICLITALIMALAFATGCGRRVKRAPVDTVDEALDNELKISKLEEMAREYPEDENVYFALGNIYYDDASPMEARLNYEKALELNPKFNKARINLAMLYAETADPDTALALLAEALAIDPKDPKAYNNIGMINYSKGNMDGAVKAYSRSIEIDPDNAESHYNLGLAFAESGLLVEALREWRVVLELEPEGELADRTRVSLERVEKLLAR